MRVGLGFLAVVLLTLIFSCGGDSDRSGGSGNGTGNGGSENDLSLEEYLRELEGVMERSQRLESLERPDIPETASLEDGKQVIVNYFSEAKSIIADASGGVDGLDPPEEAQGAHDNFVEALSGMEGVLDAFVGEIEAASSASKVQEIGISFADRIRAAAQRTIAPCNDLQNLADNNDFVVDLRCDA